MKEDEAKYVARMGETGTVWAQTLAAAIILFSVLTNVCKELHWISVQVAWIILRPGLKCLNFLKILKCSFFKKHLY